MSATIPESHLELLEKPEFATFVTIMPDGQPQATVVHCTYDGTHVIVNTKADAQKTKNVRKNPKVTALVRASDNPWFVLEVRGEVEEVTEDGALDHLNWMAQNYMGKPAYYGHVVPAEMADKETRVLLKVKPTRVVTFKR
ncbi:MAG: PPOX class F420-dependent oxidoreductase [Chloroflexi bacterium]|nr:MAG: PPOX class F420-dependent oxidoreductase [Chloroflexota bacterium]